MFVSFLKRKKCKDVCRFHQDEFFRCLQSSWTISWGGEWRRVVRWSYSVGRRVEEWFITPYSFCTRQCIESRLLLLYFRLHSDLHDWKNLLEMHDAVCGVRAVLHIAKIAWRCGCWLQISWTCVECDFYSPQSEKLCGCSERKWFIVTHLIHSQTSKKNKNTIFFTVVGEVEILLPKRNQEVCLLNLTK